MPFGGESGFYTDWIVNRRSATVRNTQVPWTTGSGTWDAIIDDTEATEFVRTSCVGKDGAMPSKPAGTYVDTMYWSPDFRRDPARGLVCEGP
jgi:hypothetical protein